MNEPHLIVLFGATGDLARRKLLPGIMHLLQSGLVPDSRIIGVSLDDFDDDSDVDTDLDEGAGDHQSKSA